MTVLPLYFILLGKPLSFLTYVQGLQSPVLGQRLCFQQFDTALGYAGNEYIQVLQTGSDHWITIEILGDDEVRVFDSVYLEPKYYVLKQIASIIKSQSRQIHLQLERVQCQRNNIDCGIYAVAYMTDLYHRGNPSSFC